MAKVDVELLIKARDEASQTGLAIAAAYEKLTTTLEKFSSEGGSTSSLLDQLANATKGLFDAYGNITGQADRAEQAFQRQQTTLAETKEQLAAVQAQMESASVAAQKLAVAVSVLDAERAAPFVARLQLVNKEQKNLADQAAKLTATIDRQSSALSKDALSLQQIGSTANAAEIALQKAAAASVGNFAQGLGGLRSSESVALGAQALARSLPAIAPAAAEASAEVQTLWGRIKSLLASLVQVPGASNRAASGVSRFGSSNRTALSFVQRLRSEILSLITAYAGLYAAIAGIEKVLTVFQAFQTAENKLGVLFSQNAELIDVEMQRLKDESVRLGIPFSTLSDQFSTFAVNAQQMGFSLQGTRKIFTAVAETARVLHLNQDQVNRVFLAFTEMIERGTVQSQQLNRQLAKILPAPAIFAQAIGKSTHELTVLMGKGQVLANEDTLGKVADQLIKMYGTQLPQALQSTQTQIGRFQALVQLAALQVSKGGFIQAFGTILKQFNEFAESSQGAQFFESVGAAMGRIAGLVPVIVENFGLISDAFRAWISYRIVQFFIDLGTSAIAAARKAGGAFAALSGAVGGIYGLLATIATFIATTWLTNWLTSVNKADAAMEEHRNIVLEVKQAYEDAGGAVDQWAKKIKDVTALQAINHIQDLRDALSEIKSEITPITAGPTDAASFGKVDLGPQTQGIPKAAQDLNALIQKFRDGKIAATDFNKAVSDFALTNPKYREQATQILEVTNSQKAGAKSAIELENSLKEAQAILRVVTGKATADDAKLLGVALTGNARSAGSFTEALTRLRDLAPTLKKEDTIEAAMKAAKEAETAALAVAKTQTERAQVIATYNQVIADLQEHMPGVKQAEAAERKVDKFTDALDAQVKKWKDLAEAATEAGLTEGNALVPAQQELQRKQFVLAQVDDWTRRATAAGTSLSAVEHELGINVAASAGAFFDQTQKLKQAKQVADQVIGLGEQLKTAKEELQTAITGGESQGTIDRLQAQIAELTQKFQTLLPLAIAFDKAMGDPKAVAQLEELTRQLNNVKTGIIDAKEANIQLAETGSGVWGNFLSNLKQGQSILESMRNAFLQAAQDFVSWMTQMILKQQILNALRDTNIGKSLAGFINSAAGVGDSAAGAALTTAGTTLTTAGTTLATAAAALQTAAVSLSTAGATGGIGGLSNWIPAGAAGGSEGGGIFDSIWSWLSEVLHEGGIVGSGSAKRSVAANVFNQAMRFHSGGLPGLRANEVAAILERGEEVLTRDDPRNVLNGGGKQGSLADRLKINIINTIDPNEFLSKAFGSGASDHTILNWMRANKSAVKAQLA